MSFEARLPEHLERLRRELRGVNKKLSESRAAYMDSISDENHEMCCSECPRKDAWEEAWDEAEEALGADPLYRELELKAEELEAEIKRLKVYGEAVGVLR